MEIINQYIKSHFEDSIQVKNQILQDKALIELIQKVALITTNAYKNGFKTMLAGNGGSAADAQHIAGEFVSRFYFDRPGIPSIALTTDTSILTAIGNDYGYDRLFLPVHHDRNTGGQLTVPYLQNIQYRSAIFDRKSPVDW